jgi:hypothetical protein
MNGATLDLRDRGVLASGRSAKIESFVIFPVFPAASPQNTAALQSSRQFPIGGQYDPAGVGFERPDVSI